MCLLQREAGQPAPILALGPPSHPCVFASVAPFLMSGMALVTYKPAPVDIATVIGDDASLDRLSFTVLVGMIAATVCLWRRKVAASSFKGSSEEAMRATYPNKHAAKTQRGMQTSTVERNVATRATQTDIPQASGKYNPGPFVVKTESPSQRGPFLGRDRQKHAGLWHTAGKNQLWMIEHVRADVYTLRTHSHAERGPFLSHDQRATVDLWHARGANQYWRITLAGSGACMISAVSSTSRGPYLSHDGRKTVDLWTRVGCNQRWLIPGWSPAEA